MKLFRKLLTMIHRLLLPWLLLAATVFATASEPLPAFAVGQQWSYPTRKSEPDSRLVILRIDDHPKLGRIVHVGVLGAKLRLVAAQPPVPWTIGHMPFPEAVLQKNVTTLEQVRSDATFADFKVSYAKWKVDADAGKKQFWTFPVAKAIENLEWMIRKSREYSRMISNPTSTGEVMAGWLWQRRQQTNFQAL